MKALFPTFFLICVFATHAEIYKWVDPDGVIHYSDTKPQDETIAIEEFLGSSITIDDSGVVAPVGEKSATQVSVQAPVADAASPSQPEKNTWNLARVWLAVKTSVESWLGHEDQKITPQNAPSTAVTVAAKPATKAAPESTVISNENMGEILSQIEQDQQAKADALSRQSVEIFTAPWCGYCKKAIAFLELNQVAYEEHDVSQSPAAALRQKMLGGGSGVPFAVINGEKISGWSQQAYARALER